MHAFFGYAPLYVNCLTYPHVPLKLPLQVSCLGEGGVANRLDGISLATLQNAWRVSRKTRLYVIRYVRDTLADSQNKQKEQADAKCSGCIERFELGDHRLLNARSLPTNIYSAVFKTKFRPRLIGSLTVVAKKGLAYTLNLPRELRTSPVFFVGLLKPFRDPSHVNLKALAPQHLALPSAAESETGCQAEPPSGLDPTLPPEVEPASP